MDYHKKLREIISSSFFVDDDEIDDERSFSEQGILTSRNVLELIVQIEKVFQIEINIEETSMSNFSSVSAICQYLEQMDAVKTVIKNHICQELLFDEDQIKDDDSLFLTNRIDANYLMELILFIEKKYGMVFLDRELDLKQFDSINKIAENIMSKVARKNIV
jgi:acyl carrier protein